MLFFISFQLIEAIAAGSNPYTGAVVLSGYSGNRESQLRDLLGQMQAAIDEVDKAGVLHNPELAGAVYEQIIKLASERWCHRRE